MIIIGQKVVEAEAPQDLQFPLRVLPIKRVLLVEKKQATMAQRQQVDRDIAMKEIVLGLEELEVFIEINRAGLL